MMIIRITTTSLNAVTILGEKTLSSVVEKERLCLRLTLAMQWLNVPSTLLNKEMPISEMKFIYLVYLRLYSCRTENIASSKPTNDDS